jgi:hypothetical protein
LLHKEAALERNKFEKMMDEAAAERTTIMELLNKLDSSSK